MIAWRASAVTAILLIAFTATAFAKPAKKKIQHQPIYVASFNTNEDCPASRPSCSVTQEKPPRAVPAGRRKAGAVAKLAPASAAAPVATAFGGGNSIVAEARRYIGTNPTNRRSLWCGAFMSMVLERTGHKPGGNLARGYANYGQRVSGPQVGALAVMSRGRGGGHVGVVTGIDPSGNVIVVSGNHNNTVAESVYPRRRIFAYVIPNT